MDTGRLCQLLNYPPIWAERHLVCDEFFVPQAAEFEREYGYRVPQGGTEHWRYGAFLFWLRRNTDSKMLAHLLAAAIADPDPPMAGNVIKTIIAHPSSTEQMLRLAVSAVTENQEYFVTQHQLESSFSNTHGAEKNVP
jgi:hypothetical protein